MEYLERRRALVESRLEAVLDATEPDAMTDRLEHVSLSGGKRVRPMVALLAFEAAGGELVGEDGRGSEPSRNAIDFAVGIELVHNASLVVDDIIDESELRRGVDSAWAAFGYGPAITTSDGLLGEAFSLFSADPRAMRTVAEAMVELGEGEATELVERPDSEAAYMELARRKTGALFRAAAELGAIAADADTYAVDAFGQYAERVGIAFQIRDDVLDATADADDLGKPTGQDAEMERPSVVQITDMSPDEANERARTESDAALSSLSAADTVDSEAVGYLEDLAEFVVVRER
ncbi:bifunctional short chain isoprenyl diphosphate synthase [Natronomonas pharaonis DSM 2160]|uniref:Bifunctional short chain isoprenyl diphosphate synthase n=1 Tax=Natronomonas pharaonis (strain ATCC 35678 / DSM 2160 / CIP 103997 / JCM 8858 / NBRC 14720 / NCIMB 2260 / Gabara) TaxID=348780 RepID=A0A1U7ETY1_NATPD|nr:polyprenyl synthetase family protein [Natronomonas pharaonis]CAI48393.1 bifunctional short chain isoprenyl diphosphate synthase [Natronomonas pharaonis DSM 2160]